MDEIYNLSFFDNGRTLNYFVSGINEHIFNNTFGILMLVALAVILFVTMGRFETHDRMVAITFILMIASWLMYIITLVNMGVVYLCIVMFLVAFSLLIFRG